MKAGEWQPMSFFSIINEQLENSDIKFYALYGGNDLHGLFLTEEEFEVARKDMDNKRRWPYIPRLEPPEYGCPW